MYYHPKKATANEDRIFKQRQYENALQDKINFVHKYESLMRYAQFERLNGPRTDHRSLTEKLEAIRAQREHTLSERRQKLHCLLEDEDNMLHAEMRTGNMNLAERRAWLKAQARNESIQRHGHPETHLERALRESMDDVCMYNTKLAIHRTEEQRKRSHKDVNREDYDKSLHQDMEMAWRRQDETHSQNLDHEEQDNEEAIDILRRQLGLVQRLREDERCAVEEDMIHMHRKWLEEEEALKLKHYEQRHLQSQNAHEVLLSKLRNNDEKIHDAHMVALVAEKEAEEERQEKELKEAHRKEARAYVSQLRAAAERQKFEDAELEAMIKAEMNEDWHKQDIHPHRAYPPAHEEQHHSQPYYKESTHKAQEEKAQMAPEPKLSKQDLRNALEARIRAQQAEELVNQERKRVESEGDKVAPQAPQKCEIKVKQTLADLPYAEPWYGRKAVKWYE